MARPELGLRIGAELSKFIRMACMAGALATANPALDRLFPAMWRGTSSPVFASVGTGVTSIAAGGVLAVAVVCGGLLVATIVHEAGHYLAARALRQPVTAVHIYSPPARLTFGLGGTLFHLGWGTGGRVVLERSLAPGRGAIFAAAGPAANLLAVPIVLALPLPGPLKLPLVMIFAVFTLSNLVPQRTRHGLLSDGANLLRGPARSRTEKAVRALLADPGWRDQPGAAGLLVRGIRLEVPSVAGHYFAIVQWLAQSGRPGDLLVQHRRELALPAKPSRELVQAVHYSEWLVAIIPGLPKADCELADRRLRWVLEHCDADMRAPALHTLAVIRLRQGLPARAEALCDQCLTAMLEPDHRATVLATIAMARHAAGQSGREALDEALALSPDADLVSEAVAAVGSDPALSL